MLSATYSAVILLAFFSGLTILIGVTLTFYFKRSVRGIVIGIGFSAGIMMLISFFELIPESVGAAGILKPLIAVFSGVILIGILNFIIPHTHLVEEKGHIHIRSLKAAYLVAFGLILHDFPEGFAMAVPLLLTEKKKLLFKAAFLSGLAEPAGAVLGFIAVSFLPALNPLFMAFAAGAIIFISIHELLPMACRYKRISLFISGVVLSVIVYTGLAILIKV